MREGRRHLKIIGADRLKKKLAKMPAVARQEIDKALRESAGEIAAMAKAFAPRKSGDLQNSIGFTVGEYKPENANVRGVAAGGRHDLSVTIHAGDAKAFYAAWVEFGTASHENGGMFEGSDHPGASAQPYFMPAYRFGRKRAKSRISRAVTRAAKKVAAGK
jgi:HK97 gp10 family phage protein